MEKTTKKKSNKLKIIFFSVVAGLVILLGVFVVYNKYVLSSFSDYSFRVYVRPTTTYNEIIDTLSNNVTKENVGKFKNISKFDKYENKIKPGSYLVDTWMNVFDVYRNLSTGKQTPVNVSFNNIRTIDNFSKKVSSQLMFENEDLIKALNSQAIQEKYGFTKEEFVSMFLPDTYQFYWTVSVDDFLNRMKREYDKFWNEERVKKAENLGLTPTQVSTIASIAEEETNNVKERGVVGRLYMNRVQKNMPLQADPTVKFALQDFSLRRIKNEHLKVNSPYNTYKNPGLPPGPIKIPSKTTIDSILDSEPHDFIYMCAKEDFSGLHNFAVTYKEHMQNAAKYRNALNKRKIY